MLNRSAFGGKIILTAALVTPSKEGGLEESTLSKFPSYYYSCVMNRMQEESTKGR